MIRNYDAPFLIAATLLVNVSAASDSSAERPNILIVMTNDLRIGMLSGEGHPYVKTPNLDRFTNEGVRFNNCYAMTPVCGPSRASTFTGQHASMHMRRDNSMETMARRGCKPGPVPACRVTKERMINCNLLGRKQYHP